MNIELNFRFCNILTAGPGARVAPKWFSGLNEPQGLQRPKRLQYFQWLQPLQWLPRCVFLLFLKSPVKV